MAVVYRRLEAQPYGCVVHFYAGAHAAALKAMWRRHGGEHVLRGDANGLMWELAPNTGEFMVWVRHRGDVPTVTHELAHATFAVLRRVGVKPHPAAEEAFTYLLGHLVAGALA